MGATDLLYSVETNGELEPGLHQEWLLTNGLGGFAHGTTVGCNTRRYHGLLIAATKPPVGRVNALSRIGEILHIDGHDRPLEFSVNTFRDNVFPRGDQYLRRFHLGDGFARWEYDIEGVQVVKELQLLWQQNIVGIRYTLLGTAGRKLKLQLLPFTALRDFHAMRRAGDVRFDVQSGEKFVQINDERIGVRIACEGNARFIEKDDWWYGHVYGIETDRGQDDAEDLFTPGHFIAEGTGNIAVTLWARIAEATNGAKDTFDWDASLKSRPVRKVKGAGAAIQRLAHAAADFVVKRTAPDGSDGSTVIAGYPWFADWGRDTFISMPGLMLATGRFDEAKQVLSVFAQYVSEGMIPNRFDDYNNQPHYNTVDASLWFIHACHEYARRSGDKQTFEKRLLPACREVIEGYTRGTRFHIRMDPNDGLITQGDAHTQLTWMDAKCGDIAFTPRQGKPVEINALWYNALKLMGLDDRAEQVKKSFQHEFWLSPFRGLADVVHIDGSRDSAIRPNQIFAVSLPHSPLSEEQQHAVVEVVRRELLTPVGLRTLSRDNPGYMCHYCGPQFDRDRTYHNGMVWPWLIGAFLEAYIKVNRRSGESLTQARAWLAPLMSHLESAGCIGSISEIFEPEAPYRPVGCPAQAWSVAEVLRISLELESTPETPR